MADYNEGVASNMQCFPATEITLRLSKMASAYSPLQKNSPRNFTVRRFGYSNHLPNRIMKQMIHHWKALI